jgi:hypothetical protein
MKSRCKLSGTLTPYRPLDCEPGWHGLFGDRKNGRTGSKIGKRPVSDVP